MKKLLLLSLALFSFNLYSRDDLAISSFEENPNLELVCTIICPDDIIVTLDPGSCDAEVSYTVTSTMCSGSIVQTSGLPSGSTFPIGTTSNCFQIQSATCCFNVTVNEYPTPTTTLACNDNIQVSVDDNCEAFIETDMILEGGPYGCYNDYIVSVQGYGSGFGGVFVNSDAVGQTLSVTVTDPETGNTCFGTISVEDKLPPIITCPPTENFTACDMTHPNGTGYATAVDNCTNSPLITYSDEDVTDICPGIGSGIYRTWTATDESGNYAQCVQEIGERCQAHHIFFNEVTSTSISLEWTNGNGDQRIVEISTSPTFYLPVNGLTYSFETEYQGSNQQIVYVGAGDNVTVTKLTPNETYWFHVYESYCYENSPTYYLIDEVGNPKSQTTTTDCNQTSVIPSTILSPVPCIASASPWLYQSHLPCDLATATIPNGPCQSSNCYSRRCNMIEWNINPSIDGIQYDEVIPKARKCFLIKNNIWEFRQRGFITGYNNCRCNVIKQCETTTQSMEPAVTHSENGCWDKDDRYAWDVSFTDQDMAAGVCVYAIAAGTVTYHGSSAIEIKHTIPSSGKTWISWYDKISPKWNLTSVVANQHIGHIKQTVDKNKNNVGGSHLHFGVYEMINGKRVSKDRDIIPNTVSISGVPYTLSNIKGNCFGSIVSGAKISFKKEDTWFSSGTTDMTGSFNILTVPGINFGDSISITANGYKDCSFVWAQDLESTGIKMPMIKDNSEELFAPSISIINDSPIFTENMVQFKVSGAGVSNVSVFKLLDTEEEVELEPIISGIVVFDSIYSLLLQDTGSNTFSFYFEGIDSAVLQKEFVYIPLSEVDSSTMSISIEIDPNLRGTNITIDNYYNANLNYIENDFKLMPGSHDLKFTKHGYYPKYLTVDQDISLNLSLMEYSTDEFSYNDSCSIIFQGTNGVHFCRNTTIYDSLSALQLSHIQYDHNYSDMGLINVSRTFRFSNLGNSTGNLKCSMILDQSNGFNTDSIYLLKTVSSIDNNKVYSKIDISGFEYDSIEQKLDYDSLNFKNVNFRTQSLVLMKRQNMNTLKIDTVYLSSYDTTSLLLRMYFIDPDSVQNDFTFQFPDSVSNLIALSIYEDVLQIIANSCESTIESFDVYANHDGIQVANKITVVISEPATPLINAIEGTRLCFGDSLSLTADSSSEYMWSNGDTAQTVVLYNAGEFVVTVTDNNGCTAVSDPVTIEQINAPIINLGPDTSVTSHQLVLDAGPNGAQYEWSNGDTTQIIVVTTPGEYSITITDSNGCQASDTIKVDFITGTSSYALQGIRVYPNPSLGVFHLEFSLSSPEKVRYEIYDSMGQMTLSDMIESTAGNVNTILSVPNVKPGIYYLRLCFGSDSHVIKLVVL